MSLEDAITDKLRTVFRAELAAAVRQVIEEMRSELTAGGAAELLTTTEAAAAIKTTPQHVARAIRAGHLPASRVGRGWRVKRSDLDAFVASDEPGPSVADVVAGVTARRGGRR